MRKSSDQYNGTVWVRRVQTQSFLCRHAEHVVSLLRPRLQPLPPTSTPVLSLKLLVPARQARKTIKAGCEACPDNEDVWLEGARLQTPENAKTVLANAIRNLPTSVKIWLRAAELESNVSSKKVTDDWQAQVLRPCAL